MGVEIKEFGEIQKIHALAMMKSGGGAATPTLLYALDCLLKRYDNGLPSPSDLRCRLRESNYLRRMDLEASRYNTKQMTMNSPTERSEVPKIDVSYEKHVALCRQMRVNINRDKNVFDLAKEVIEKHPEADLNLLLQHLQSHVYVATTATK